MSEQLRPEVHRISLLEAQDFYRTQDGLEPGSTTVLVSDAAKQCDTITTLYQEYLDEQSKGHEFDSVEEYFEYTYVYQAEDYEENFEQIAAVKRGLRSAEEIVQVLDAQNLLSDETFIETNDPRRTSLNTIVYEFTQMTGHERADLYSCDIAAEFAKHYQAKLEAMINENKTIEVVAAARSEFVELLNAPVGTRLLGRDIVAKITPNVEAIPIQIMGPLDPLASTQQGSDFMGRFTPRGMVIQIDPFAITGSNESYGGVQSIQDTTKSTVFHELLHVPSVGWHNHVTYEYNDDGDKYSDTYLRVSMVWPEFYMEGMTEKLASYFFAHAAHDAGAETVRVREDRDMWRKNYTSDPAQVLKTRQGAQVAKHRYESYEGYRLAIDVLFDKLDWSAADMTKRQAETLAARAFFDMPDDISRGADNCAYLRSFNTALTKAGHQGILARIGNLATVAGTETVLDLLESEQFNPHDKQSIPSAGGPHLMHAIMSQTVLRANATREMHQLAESAGYYPDDIIEDDRIKVRKAELMLEAQGIVTQGLRAAIYSQFGHRARSLNPEQRLLQSIFGSGQLPTKWEYVSEDSQKYMNLQKRIAALAIWLEQDKPEIQALSSKGRNK